jgi:hypothetical protein
MPKKEPEVTLHPVVSSILKAMKPLEKGLGLTESDFAEWSRKMVRHTEAKDIAVHLLAIAKRFYQNKVDLAAAQMVVLATQAIGSTAAQPSEAVIDQATKRLAEKNVRNAPGATAGGLAPPGKKKRGQKRR